MYVLYILCTEYVRSTVCTVAATFPDRGRVFHSTGAEQQQQQVIGGSHDESVLSRDKPYYTYYSSRLQRYCLPI